MVCCLICLIILHPFDCCGVVSERYVTQPKYLLIIASANDEENKYSSPSDLFQIHCFMLEQCLTADCIGFPTYGVFLQVRPSFKDRKIKTLM